METKQEKVVPAAELASLRHSSDTFLSPDLRLAHCVTDSVNKLNADATLDRKSAYIVGGWCRDKVMGRETSDIDLEVFNLPPVQLLHLLRTIDDYHVIEPNPNRPTPFKVILEDGAHLDIVTPFIEINDGKSGPRAVAAAPHLSLEEAASRRDFTCNSIYYDAVSDRFIDPMDGIKDIQNRCLRLTPGHTTGTLNAGMALRACWLSADLNFTLDNASKEIIKAAVEAGLLDNVDKGTLTKEFLKMLCRPECPSVGLRIADELGVLRRLFPELAGLKDIPQSTTHHPEGSVFEHTMLAVDAAAQLSKHLDDTSRFTIILGTLLHDLGKLTTTNIAHDDNRTGKITAYGHELAGVKIAKTIFKRLEIGRDTIRPVIAAIKNHMRPLELESSKASSNPVTFDNQVRQLVRDVHPLPITSFLLVCRADRLGRASDPAAKAASLAIIDKIEDSVKQNGFDKDPVSKLLVWQDLLALGLSEDGHNFQHILASIEALRDKGRIDNREKAIGYVLKNHVLTRDALERCGITEPKVVERFYRAFQSEITSNRLQNVSDVLTFAETYVDRNDTDRN